jgi:hypothetical protein
LNVYAQFRLPAVVYDGDPIRLVVLLYIEISLIIEFVDSQIDDTLSKLYAKINPESNAEKFIPFRLRLNEIKSLHVIANCPVNVLPVNKLLCAGVFGVKFISGAQSSSINNLPVLACDPSVVNIVPVYRYGQYCIQEYPATNFQFDSQYFLKLD